MDTEIYFSSAKQLAYKIKQKQISCTELMQVHLDRLKLINPKLNALVQTLSSENALRQARHADEELAKNKPVGPLHGLPITIKDCCKVKGFAITKGSLGLHFLPTEDATVVDRLKTAGAIVLGISNVPEFNIAYETDNDRYGRTLNPYDLSRTPGGSSGGEAAIIAAGGSTFGLGTDAAGSIRQPAHNTGIASLKPTHGLLPNTGMLPDDGGHDSLKPLTTYGLMARFVDDLILTLPVLSATEAYNQDILCTKQIDVESLRIAYYADNAIIKPDEDTLRTIQNVINNLPVAQLKEARPPHLPELYSLISETLILKGDKGLKMQTLLYQLGIKNPSYLVKEFLAIARSCEFSETELTKRLHRLEQLRRELEKFFIDYDVIICPVAATPAKQHTRSFIEGHDFSYLSVYNFTGWPVSTVRCGTSVEGLPIGIQIIAKPWKDMTALWLAKKLETLLGGWKPPPLFP